MAVYSQFISSNDNKSIFSMHSPIPKLKLDSATEIERVKNIEIELSNVESLQKAELRDIQGIQMSVERTMKRMEDLEKRKKDLEKSIADTNIELRKLLSMALKMKKKRSFTVMDNIKKLFGVRKSSMKK